MTTQKLNAVNRLTAIHKLLISIALAVIVYFIIPFDTVKALPHVIFCWDIFSLCLLILSWITFYTTSAGEIRRQARRQDDSRIIIFFLVLIAACVSMLAVILLLTSQGDDTKHKALQLSVGIACMMLSWLLMHTVFTTRYAHMYYADHATKADTHAGGLDFPGESKPDFVDFAYFSFTLGMTFQVSDVEISARKIRRLALWHGFISFGYNATIIALTVNIVAGLTQG